MSTQRRRHYETDLWSIDIMSNYPWWADLFIDLVTLLIAALWMAWTYATVQQQGTSPLLLITSVSIILVLVLLVYRQRLTYLQIGDRIVVGFEEGGPSDDADTTEWQKENQ